MTPSARRICTYILFCFLFFYILPSRVFAKFSLKIEKINPNSISSKTEEIEATLSISNLPSESYFRVSLQESSGKPYFGLLKNDREEWVKIMALSSDDCDKYYKVSDLSTSELNLLFKVGEENEINPGNYIVKAHKFTLGCSYTEATNTASLVINIPTSTPTPTNTPTPQPTPKPTSTPKPPTSTPKPKNTQKPDSASEPTQQLTVANDKTINTEGSVLAAKSDNDKLGESEFDNLDFFLPTSTPSASPTGELSPIASQSFNTRKKIGYIFYTLGALAIIASGVSAYKIAKST